MSKVKVLYAAVLGLLLLNAAMLVWLYRQSSNGGPAGRHEGGPGGPPETGPNAGAYIIRELQLDAAQQDSFNMLKQQHSREVRQLREESRRLHDAYFALLKTDQPNTGQADSLVNLIGSTQRSIDRLNFDHFRAIRALCNDKQKKLYDRTIDEIARRVGGPPPGPRHDGLPH